MNTVKPKFTTDLGSNWPSNFEKMHAKIVKKTQMDDFGAQIGGFWLVPSAGGFTVHS